MAIKDNDGRLDLALEAVPDCDQLRQMEIERLFIDLGRQFGFSEADLLFPNDAAEQATVVYDKFSVHRR